MIASIASETRSAYGPVGTVASAARARLLYLHITAWLSRAISLICSRQRAGSGSGVATSPQIRSNISWSSSSLFATCA